MSLVRIRSLLAVPTGAAPPRPPATIPPWTLVPGLAALAAALFAYAQYVRNYHIWGLDLAVYQGGAAAFTHGQNPYAVATPTSTCPTPTRRCRCCCSPR